MKRIAAITTVRNDDLFVKKWIGYYGAQFGFRNLFVFLDGHDQPRPDCPGADEVNFISLPRLPMERVPAMRRRARVMSHLAAGLFHYFEVVIATDVDEFLVVDPDTDVSLGEYLSTRTARRSLSGLGLDVGQNLNCESALDPARPFLDQRSFAHLSSRYTKPNTAFRPVTWGSGMHRIKGHNYHIDPNLFLFHFGMVDLERSGEKTNDTDRLATGWREHLGRREKLFRIVTDTPAQDGDKLYAKARHYQTWHRPLLALNKPGQMPGNPVVRIPERFRGIV